MIRSREASTGAGQACGDLQATLDRGAALDGCWRFTPSKFDSLLHLLRNITIRIGQVKQWLNDLRWKHSVLLPQVQYSNHFALLFFGALVEMVESKLNILGKSWSKDVFFGSKLMPGLPDDRIDDIQARYLVLRSTFLDELFHTLDDVLVKFDGLDGPLGDGGHLGLGDGGFELVER